ncbi:hypothetical protein, partial [Desulfosarcina cetonica]|uniref:hypothetical protein n=1 Tax=Desulfosarcina cetonica TaxID=90730 RepID=UPI0012ECCF1C
MAWPLMVAIHFILLRTLETTWQRKVSAVWHVAGALLVIQLLAWEAGWLMDRLAGGTATWSAM